jgi:hypothetical protein
MIWGKLEKLKIKAFRTPRRVEGVLADLLVAQTYQAMFNPESYSFNYTNEFQKQRGIHTAGRTAHYALSKSSELSFKFLIDDSSATAGLTAGAPSLSVGGYALRKTIHDRVEEFLDLTGRINGELHEPHYLRLEWGDLIFDCRLKSVDVSYTLFNRSGRAIRAELDATFVEDLDPQKAAIVTDKQSPDLTHERQVMDGDTLPLMTYRIYRDASQYIRVAQANKVDNFRRLKPKTNLRFPPIQSN